VSPWDTGRKEQAKRHSRALSRGRRERYGRAGGAANTRPCKTILAPIISNATASFAGYVHTSRPTRTHGPAIRAGTLQARWVASEIPILSCSWAQLT